MPRLSSSQLGYFIIFCWEIWKQRNNKIWNNKAPAPVRVVLHNAKSFLEEWRMAASSGLQVSDASRREDVSWSKPQHGFLKMNVDAAINSEHARMGFGCVIRDANGCFVAAKETKWNGIFTPREAEAVAVREALSWIKTLNFDKVHVETDSLTVVQSLNQECGESSFHLVVKDIKNLLSCFAHVFLSFVKRSVNRAAHLLAKRFVSSSDCME
nr:uncharacterized protein LOC109186242 [Ipomoea batatas]